MGNAAVAGEPAGSDELDEPGRLDLSETEPEDGDEDGDDGEQEDGETRPNTGPGSSPRACRTSD